MSCWPSTFDFLALDLNMCPLMASSFMMANFWHSNYFTPSACMLYNLLWCHYGGIPEHPTMEILVKHGVLDPYSQLLGQSIFKELSYCIVQKFDGGNFDKWLAICQSFPYKPLSLNVSPLKPMINLSKFYWSNSWEWFICQIFPRHTFVLYGTRERYLIYTHECYS